MKEVLAGIFGSQLKEYKKINASLPIYLKSGRSFYEITVDSEKFVMAEIDRPERLNVSALKKQLSKYYDVFGINIVLGFTMVTSFQRKSLVENGISFVSGNGQVYLPFLGAFFSRCQMYDYHHETVLLSPSAQALLLLLIYNDTAVCKSEAAKRLGVSAMTVTRASAELSELGLIKEQKKGTELLISIIGSRNEVFKEAREYLINPIHESVYVETERKYTGIAAGEYALSERTDLGYPKYYEYAVSKKEYRKYGFKEYDPDLETDRSLVRIQKWIYSPELFAAGEKIDPISLICSFNGEEDERIHKCLTEVEKEIGEWRPTKN